MEQNDLFDRLVNYHINVNLKKCKPHIKRSRILNRDGMPYEEAYDENDLYKGVIFIANGNKLADRLIDDKIVLRPDTREELEKRFVSFYNADDIVDYASCQRNGDGAYVINGDKKKIARVNLLNNNPTSLPRHVDISDLIPSDFVSHDGCIDCNENLGTKTLLAALLTQAYDNTHAFQIKKSAYTDFGMGKVTHFDKFGLNEEFFILSPEQGVYRRYDRSRKRVEEVVSLDRYRFSKVA